MLSRASWEWRPDSCVRAPTGRDQPLNEDRPVACRMISSATLPRKKCDRPWRADVPTTIRSADSDLAQVRI